MKIASVRWSWRTLALLAVLAPGSNFAPLSNAQESRTDATATNRTSSTARGRTNDPIARIRDEGLNHSQVMQTLSYLTDVIGPRLTGSPNMKRANEWTRDKLKEWGMSDASVEPWGTFGRGWSLKRFSAQVIEPQSIPLAAVPKAWTPGFDKPLTAEVVYIDAKSEGDLEKYAGKLKGAIVLAGPVRELRARFEPLASRLAESNLLRLANMGPGDTRSFSPGRGAGTNSTSGTNIARADGFVGGTAGSGSRETETQPASTNVSRGFGGRGGSSGLSSTRILSFAAREGAALVVTPSSEGDGGTVFVAGASVPGAERRGTNAPGSTPRAWSTNAPAMPAQIAVAAEDYNRLVRMIRQGEKLKMEVDLQVQFHSDDLIAYNTIAEIPGSDLKNELVMIGAHLDSWHCGTGATDNGAGVAATMEAMRILKTLNLQPRRTIRIGLWSGEEQGLLGSRGYVAKHFGYYTNITNSASVRSPRDESNNPRRRFSSTNSTSRKLVRHRDYDKFSAYFNLDNGTGKIRGVYLQGNEGVRPFFRKWLQPFYDLDAATLTYGNTGGTDHQSFDGVGLPGFQFIQDPIDYYTRTHHSNADVYDRVQVDDMKQAATIMAAFLYNAATIDEKLPRKALD